MDMWRFATIETNKIKPPSEFVKYSGQNVVFSEYTLKRLFWRQPNGLLLGF